MSVSPRRWARRRPDLRDPRSDGGDVDGKRTDTVHRLRLGVDLDAASVTIGVRGVKPVTRCVVPSRDLDTGIPTHAFWEQFLTRQEETFPPWTDPRRSTTTLARPANADRGEVIEVGDDVGGVDPSDHVEDQRSPDQRT